jgi:hypothetical protein
MSDYTDIQVAEQNDIEKQNWMPKVLVFGAVIGAVTGLMGAFLLIQRSKDDPEPPKMDAREGVRLGVLVLGLLRQISLLGRDD